MFEKLGRLLKFGGGEMLPAQDAYALWAESYPPRPHNPLMEVEQSVVAPTLVGITHALSRDHLRTRRALDVGTGTGRYLPLVAAAGMKLTVGLDLSMAMLQRQSLGYARICADACRLPFPDASFDVVCSSLMAGDVERVDQFLSEVSRVLAPGGHLVYSDFHPSWVAEHWRRTFHAPDGRLIELSYFPHAIEDHLSALGRSSLSARTIREPRIEGRRAPVVVVFHAVKVRRPC
jgi:malonyl-CoA O-methyltransferase